LTTLPSLFGLSEHFDLEGRTTDEVEQAMQWVERNRPWVSVDRATSLTDLRYRCTRAELFDLDIPPELEMHAAYAWVGLGRGGYRLGLTQGQAVLVLPTILGEWEVQLRQKGMEEVLLSRPDLLSTISEAEDYVARRFSDLLPLVRLRTRWRRAPATEKQLRILRSKKIEVPKGITKGQASHLIGMLS
jgi:hypothetical protein